MNNSQFLKKAYSFLELAIPAVFCTFMMMIQEMVNLVYVGHLENAAKLAAVGLGNAIQNMIGISIIVGMNGALNSLVSQAGGAGNLDLCIMYLHRSKIVMTLCLIPIGILILNSESLLLVMGQDP